MWSAPAARSSRTPGRHRLAAASVSAAIACVASGVAAQAAEPSCSEIAEERAHDALGSPPPARVEVTATPAPKPLTGRFFGAVAVGRGVRFNNPFRLATPLGDTGESLSLTASYLDLSLGGALGRAPGVQHGMVAHLSIAMHGVPQQTLTPSYVQTWRLAPRFMALGRVGGVVVLSPDVNGGAEAAVGAFWFTTAGTGLTAELVGSVFYGAATRERDPTSVPVLGFQVGVFLDYEVIP